MLLAVISVKEMLQQKEIKMSFEFHTKIHKKNEFYKIIKDQIVWFIIYILNVKPKKLDKKS